MKKLIGTLALAAIAATAAGTYLELHHATKFSMDPDAAEGRTPGDPLAAAIRLGYHGNAGNLHFEPAWLRESAKQDAKIASAVPGGHRTYMPSANAQFALNANTFTLLGPQPLTGEGFGANRAAGRVNALLSDPDNTAVAWLGADGGGVWKTTNCCTSSTTWTVKTDFPQLSTMAIDDITMDPNNHNVLYAATGDLNYGSFSFGSAGVLKSTDRGETWTVLGTNVFTPMYGPSAGAYPQYQAISKVVVDPNNSNNVIAGTKTGVYFSYDAGTNWSGPCYTNAFTSGSGAQRQDTTGLLAVKSGSATKLYVAIGTRGSATPVQPDLGKNGANGVYSAAMPSSGCPAVSSWTLLSNGLPTGLGNGTPSTSLGRIEIAVAPSNTQVLYAMISDITSSGINGIWKTSNGGTSWTKASTPSSGDAGTQMWYDAGLTVSPTNPSVLFISTVDLLLSQDGGSTYTNLTNAYSGGPVHPDNHARAIVGGDANKVLNGNDGGVYYVSNALSAGGSSGANWTDMNNQLPTLEVYGGDITANFATASSGGAAAGFQDNGIGTVTFSGTPGPLAWNSNNGGDGFYSRIEPVLGKTWYSSVYYGDIYSSKTGAGGSQGGIAGSWGVGSATSVDRKSFITTYDLYRYGSTSVSGSGCTTSAGCTRVIYGTYRLWEATDGGASSSSWKAKTGDLSKNNLIVGTDNRSFIQQLHYSFTDPTIAIVGTTDGNVQYVFGLGGTGSATAVNVTGNNAVLPNRTIMDVNTDPTNPLVGYAAIAGFTANTPSTPGHVFQVTCTANCASFSWADKSGNLPDIPANAVIANPKDTKQVFVGTDWGLYFTNDITVATPVWQRFEGLPHVMVWSFTIDRGFTTLAAFTRARGVWVWPLPTGSIGGTGGTPSANFSFTTSGLTANFTDSSTDSGGTIGSHAWTFGDGGTSSATNPSHTYASAGTYSVTETVTDSANNTTSSKTASVTVAPSGGTPSANFSFTTNGLTANFTDNSTDAGGTIGAHSWTFGDGGTSTATNPSHTYAAAGTYSVTETVTDSVNSTTSSKTASVTVVSDAPPVANFTFTTSGLTATFTDASSDSDGTIASHSWTFGDGGTSTATSPSHTYAAAGTYSVTETVVDNLGASASKTASVTIAPEGNVLQNGVGITITDATVNHQQNWTMVVPAGATALTFTLSGGTGDADLYVKFGAAPTTSSYDCRPYVSGNNETCTISNIQAGTYYVMVNAYAAYSGVTLKGSYSTSTGNPLTSGVPVTGLSATTGNFGTIYTLAVPAGKTSVVFTISGGTGDADLYVRIGSAPTTASYNCRPYLSGNSETCTFNAPTAGTYYVGVRAYATYSGVTLTGTIN